MKVSRVNNTAELDAVLSSKALEFKRVFIFFFGKEEGDANQSWCPDCVIADPIVRKWLNKVPDSLLIEAPCSKSEYRGNPNHEYKIHPVFKIQWIPTLFEWSKGQILKTLGTDDDLNEDKLKDFIL